MAKARLPTLELKYVTGMSHAVTPRWSWRIKIEPTPASAANSCECIIKNTKNIPGDEIVVDNVNEEVRVVDVVDDVVWCAVLIVNASPLTKPQSLRPGVEKRWERSRNGLHETRPAELFSA